LEAIFIPLRVAAGVLMVFLVPGLPWSYVLLGRGRISAIERLGISVGLSIALVPFGLFLLNILLGVPVDGKTVLMLVLGAALTGMSAVLWRALFRVRTVRSPAPSRERGSSLAVAGKRGAAELLALGLIMGFAFYTTLIPRLDYEYPIHQDEWTHLAEARAIVTSGTMPLVDAVTGEARSSPHHEAGYHLFLAEFQLLTGLSWLTIFRFVPGAVFALTVLGAYIFGKRCGFGLEAALFASFLPTTLRFLGPGFAVPMALGLFFVPLVLFLVSNLWNSRGLPVLLLALLSFLFIAHAPTALFVSLIIVVHGLFQSVRPDPAQGAVGRRPLAQLATVVGAVALSSLPFLVYNHGIVGTAASEAPLPQEVLTAPGGIISRIGYIPYPLFVLGLGVLAMSGRSTDRALLVATALLAIFVFLYYSFRVGPEVMYSRSVLYLSMLVLLVAGLAASRIRGWFTAFLSPRWAGGASFIAAGLAIVFLLLPSLGLSLQSRYQEDYYHVINDKQYQDFVWIRDNLCPGYERALVLPKLGRPFAAITGKHAYVALPLTVLPVRSPLVEEANQVLQEGVPDAAWLRERGVSIVYSERPASNPELVRLRERVYVLPPGEICAAGG
jgi:hypothetical protein